MKRNRLFFVLNLCMILSLLLAACGGKAKPTATQPVVVKATEAQPTEAKPAGETKLLRVWIQWGDNPTQLQELFDKYTALTGIKVEVTAPVEDTKILPALTGSEPPDILILSGGDLVKSYAKENIVDELSSAIKSGGIDLTDFFPAPMTQCQQGDQIYCLPWGTDLYALFWNKDMFEAAGLDPEVPPKTMEELVEYADKLTIVKDGVIEQIGFIPDAAWGHNDLYVRMFGGFWYSDDGMQLTVNSQAMIDSYTWQQQFYKKYGFDSVLEFTTSTGDNYMSPDHPFYAGRLAMYVDGEWQTGANFISAIKPELNYGVTAFPPPADHPERAGTIVNQGTVVVIPSGAKDKEASAKLLAWMMTPAVVAEEFCYNANLPTSKKAAEDPCFTSNPKFKIFVDLMFSKNAFAVITTPLSLEINDAIGQAEEKILHTGADPKTELDPVQAEFEQKLKDALGK
jgi:multiple sugar transport system substrate-binding protein